MVIFFFFSSRRRHTRLQGDWSSDVCSSDLTVTATDRGGLSTSRTFFVTVTPVNDPPVLTAAASLLALAGAPAPPLFVRALDKETPIQQQTLTPQSFTPQGVPAPGLSVPRDQGGWEGGGP